MKRWTLHDSRPNTDSDKLIYNINKMCILEVTVLHIFKLKVNFELCAQWFQTQILSLAQIQVCFPSVPLCSSFCHLIGRPTDRQVDRASPLVDGGQVGGLRAADWWKSLAWTCSAWHGPPHDVSVDPSINPPPPPSPKHCGSNRETEGLRRRPQARVSTACSENFAMFGQWSMMVPSCFFVSLAHPEAFDLNHLNIKGSASCFCELCCTGISITVEVQILSTEQNWLSWRHSASIFKRLVKFFL